MSDVNDFLVASGEDAREINESSNEREKTKYVKLKDGESLRGYLLVNVTPGKTEGTYLTDFKMFGQHGDFNLKGIHSHSCLDPKNSKDCLSCKQGIKRTNITVVAFWDIEAKEIKVFEAKKGHMKSIYGFIDLYGEDSSTTPLYFTRNGAGTDTKYTPTPAPPSALKGKDKDLWVRPDDVMDGLDGAFYLGVINPPTEEYLRKLLGLDGVSDAKITPIDESADDLPF